MDNGGVADLSFPNSKSRRGRVQGDGQISPTLMASESDICRIIKINSEEEYMTENQELISKEEIDIEEREDIESEEGFDELAENYDLPYVIRKLMPIECFRLMGFNDDEFHRAERVSSNTALYKQAGNSIVVDVLSAIFRELINAIDAVDES